MRRALILVLMFMLPFQWSWGAAATLCAHEANVQTRHLGHHEHVHAHESAAPAPDADADAGNAIDNSADASSLNCHAGCGVCHGFGGALWAPAAALPEAWCGPAHFAPYQAAVPERTVGTLLRPPLALASLTG